MASLSSFLEWLGGWTTLRAAQAEVQVPKRLIRDLRDPQGFVEALGGMRAAIEDLTGAPGPLIVAHEHGHHGAMWAWPEGAQAHHVGVPPQTWPNLVAAANRRPVVSALVHELGHVALNWDRGTFLWADAVEGFATPVGTYACVRLGAVPAWIDFPDGSRDWPTLDAWVAEWIAQGRRAGTGAARVEGALFDLMFNQPVGYDALRTVLRAAYADREAAPVRDDHAKMTAFFVALGRAADRDLSGHLAGWGFDVTDIRLGLHGLQPLVAS